MAVRADAAAPTAAVAEGKRSRRKLLVIIAIAVIVLLAGAGAAVYLGLVPFLASKPTKPGPAVAGPIAAVGPLTLNLADGHLLQISVALQLSTTANAKLVQTDMPQIDNALIAEFAHWTYPQLLTPAGRTQAQTDITTQMQALFPPITGVPSVMRVYYTQFVMQ